MADYPIYKFVVKDEGTDTGMLGISLVSEPAMESSWETFNKENVKPQYIALKDENGEHKNELLGAALRPDLLILRKDEADNYYYGMFEKETIEVIRNKFHKQKNTSEVNLQHDQEMKVDAYLNESFIIQTEEQLSATQSLGLEDVEIGAWIVRYKVESDEVFNRALDGDLTGFSVEVLFNKELISLSQINNNNNNNKIMSKFKKLIDNFKAVLTEFEEAEETTELEDVTVAETNMILRFTEAGSEVLEVTTDDEGVETTVAAAEGEYILEDGRTLVVDADGNLAEIKDAEEEAEPVTPDEELEKEEKETPKEDLEEEKETDSDLDLNKKLSELIPTDKDGSFSLEVYVSDGRISFGTLHAWTYSDLKLNQLTEEYEALKLEKTDLTSKVEKLQKEVEKPVTAPVFTEFKGEKNNITKGKKEDFKNNLDYTINRLGLNND